MSDNERVLELIGEVFGDHVYAEVELPKITPERILESREICSQNRCGNYGASWTCPPHTGDVKDCIERLESYDHVAMAYESFEVESFEMDHLNCKIGDMQHLCRKVLRKAREEGIDLFVMCTGPCNNCEVCSFKHGIDCVDPEMCIPSVSGYGIPVRDMLKDIGHESSHSEKRIELFGMFLFR